MTGGPEHSGPPPAPEADLDMPEPDPAAPDRAAEPAVGDGFDDEEPGGTILTDAAALAAERDEYLTALQRLKADFENYRKRVQREREALADRAEGGLVVKLLPVLDNLDLAWAHLASAEDDEEARAVGQARGQILEVLGKEGLERVDAAAVAFDPSVHDAVAHAPEGEADGEAEVGAEGEAGGMVVDEVMRAGYRWRGQVLRPAMVRVRG